MEFFALFVVVGVFFQLVSYVAPIYKDQLETDYVWDAIGLIMGLIFLALVATIIVDPIVAMIEASNVFATWHQDFYSLPIAIVIAVHLVFIDFFSYWAHRFLHTRKVWPVHAWHHSPKILYWVSGMRSSPLHVFVLFGVPSLITYIVAPAPQSQTIIIALAIFGIFNQHYTHANLRLPLEK